MLVGSTSKALYTSAPRFPTEPLGSTRFQGNSRAGLLLEVRGTRCILVPMKKLCSVAVLVVFALSGGAMDAAGQDGAQKKIRARVQAHPGGPIEDVEMDVHEVPVDPETVTADEATLEDDELVLGLVIEGEAIAYPIRYLAMYEVVNDRVGDTPIAPTW